MIHHQAIILQPTVHMVKLDDQFLQIHAGQWAGNSTACGTGFSGNQGDICLAG